MSTKSSILSWSLMTVVLAQAIVAPACGGGGGGGGGGGTDGAVADGSGPSDGGAPGVDGMPDAISCVPGTSCSEDGMTLLDCDAGGNLTSTPCPLACSSLTGAPACNECAPATVACSADDLVTCTAQGTISSTIECRLGCNASATPAPRCATLAPSNLPSDTCAAPAASDLVFSADTTLFTDTDLRCQVVTQFGAPDICVITAAQVTVPAGVTVSARGARALALVATGTMTIEGTVDVSDVGFFGDAPGNAILGKGSEILTATPAGGAGAGFGTAGGNGGAAPGEIVPVGGVAYAFATLIPLIGGSDGTRGGGKGGFFNANERTGGIGGSAGGALQLVSCGDLTLGAGASLDASGRGGLGGNGAVFDLCGSGAAFQPGGGGGGGSGGGLLLEAVQLTASAGAVLVANGGAGGGGGEGSSFHTGCTMVSAQFGLPGERGQRSTTPAAGGSFVRDGGAGGALGVGPVAGENATTNFASGGGGGAVGRIRLNVQSGSAPVTAGAVLSPAPTTGSVATN